MRVPGTRVREGVYVQLPPFRFTPIRPVRVRGRRGCGSCSRQGFLLVFRQESGDPVTSSLLVSLTTTQFLGYVPVFPSKPRCRIVRHHPGRTSGTKVGPSRGRVPDDGHHTIMSVGSIFVRKKSNIVAGSRVSREGLCFCTEGPVWGGPGYDVCPSRVEDMGFDLGCIRVESQDRYPRGQGDL